MASLATCRPKMLPDASSVHVHCQRRAATLVLGADGGLERLVGGALLVVVAHVVEAREDGLAEDGVALAARVVAQPRGRAADEVRLAVLGKSTPSKVEVGGRGKGGWMADSGVVVEQLGVGGNRRFLVGRVRQLEERHARDGTHFWRDGNRAKVCGWISTIADDAGSVGWRGGWFK